MSEKKSAFWGEWIFLNGKRFHYINVDLGARGLESPSLRVEG